MVGEFPKLSMGSYPLLGRPIQIQISIRQLEDKSCLKQPNQVIRFDFLVLYYDSFQDFLDSNQYILKLQNGTH